MNSSLLNGSNTRKKSSYTQEELHSTSFLTKPRSILKTSDDDHKNSNGSSFSVISNDEQSLSTSYPTKTDLSSNMKFVVAEKEMPKVLSTNTSSNISQNGDFVSFRSSFEDADTHSEHIYENVPM